MLPQCAYLMQPSKNLYLKNIKHRTWYEIVVPTVGQLRSTLVGPRGLMNL